MKPLTFRRLLVRGFWFVALVVGVFVLIERYQTTFNRERLSTRHFIPDTLRHYEQPFASVPDTLFFASQPLVLAKYPLLQSHLHEQYYRWTSPRADFLSLLQRYYQYRQLLDSACRENNLPMDFIAVAASRSGLSPTFVSFHATHKGMWALGLLEARQAGLRINDMRDERLHLFESTAVVADSLCRLAGRKRNWLEALWAFSGHKASAVAEVLVLAELFLSPARHRQHIPPRHQSAPLILRSWILPRSAPKAWPLLTGFAIDSSLFFAHNPFLLQAQAPLYAEDRLLIPPVEAVWLKLQVFSP